MGKAILQENIMDEFFPSYPEEVTDKIKSEIEKVFNNWDLIQSIKTLCTTVFLLTIAM